MRFALLPSFTHFARRGELDFAGLFYRKTLYLVGFVEAFGEIAPPLHPPQHQVHIFAGRGTEGTARRTYTFHFVPLLFRVHFS